MEKLIETLSELSEYLKEAETQYKQECDEYWASLSEEDRLRAFYSVISRVVQGELKDRGSYRHVLYGVFGFGPESYSIGMQCGYLTLHNRIYTEEQDNEMFDRYYKLYNFVQFIANDYVELSHDKTAWQRDDFIKRARKLLEELNG